MEDEMEHEMEHKMEREKHIHIIGGSMAGAMAGYHLARRARKEGIPASITIHEMKGTFHKTCSGIVTSEFEHVLARQDVLFPKKLVLSRVNAVRIYAPGGRHLDLEFSKPDLIFDREQLNEHFISEAQDQGCAIRTKSAFTGFSTQQKKIIIKDIKTQKTHEVRADALVGADGAQSGVAAAAGLILEKRPRRYFLAIKALAKKKHDNAIEFYPFYKDFAWRNPVGDDLVEVGVATQLGQGVNVQQVFEAFAKRFPEKIFQKEAALIPVYDPRARFFTHHHRLPVYLVGDAATHAKATTGGSIVQIHQAAPILAHHVLDTTSHEQALRKEIGRDLYLHLKMHQAFSSFKDADWDDLIGTFSEKKMKDILATTPRDTPIPLVMRLLLHKPSLALLARKLVR